MVADQRADVAALDPPDMLRSLEQPPGSDRADQGRVGGGMSDGFGIATAANVAPATMSVTSHARW
jgi:hypothetical protein